MIKDGGVRVEGVSIRITWMTILVPSRDYGCVCVVFVPICYILFGCFRFWEMPCCIVRWFVGVGWRIVS